MTFKPILKPGNPMHTRYLLLARYTLLPDSSGSKFEDLCKWQMLEWQYSVGLSSYQPGHVDVQLCVCCRQPTSVHETPLLMLPTCGCRPATMNDIWNSAAFNNSLQHLSSKDVQLLNQAIHWITTGGISCGLGIC